MSYYTLNDRYRLLWSLISCYNSLPALTVSIQYIFMHTYLIFGSFHITNSRALSKYWQAPFSPSNIDRTDIYIYHVFVSYSLLLHHTIHSTKQIIVHIKTLLNYTCINSRLTTDIQVLNVYVNYYCSAEPFAVLVNF